MLDELGDGANPEQAKAAGRALLRKILDQTQYRVRERYDEPFFSRGKHHELADRGRVGWHPDFEERVRRLDPRGAWLATRSGRRPAAAFLNPALLAVVPGGSGQGVRAGTR